MTEDKFKYFEENCSGFVIPGIEYDGKKLRSVYECCNLLNAQNNLIEQKNKELTNLLIENQKLKDKNKKFKEELHEIAEDLREILK